MSASAVASCATSILCCSQGSLDYRQLYKRLCKYHTITEQLFCQILRNGSRFAIVEGTEGNIPGCELSNDTTIIAKTSVRLCKQYPKEDCADCNGLHLCRYFVCGNCRFDKERNKCRNSHDLHSVHNSNILRANQLQGLQEAELSQLLLQNDPSLLPEVCAHYNKGNGEYGSCTFKTKCTKLHICQHFLQGNCKFGQQCKRSHKFDANAQEMLEGRGLSAELISNLPSIYNNIYTINCSTGSSAGKKVRTRESSESSISDVDSDEICLFYIRKHCSFMTFQTWKRLKRLTVTQKTQPEKCIRVHFHLPYKWEVYNGLTWNDFPNMEEIEKAYCDPENTTRIFIVLPHYNKYIVNSVSSDGSPPVNFLTMTLGSAKVRRLSTASSVTKPPHFILTTEWVWYWKDQCGVWIEYGKQLIELSKSSGEFQHVEGLFKRTMAAATVHKIQRIQNPSLWKVFQWQKEQMKKKNGGESVDEKFLFHGTEQSLLDAICEQNFDWRICGVQGSLYGKGSYFARDALYSHNYSKTRTGTQILFVARVLVGEFTRGKSNYVRPPPKDGNNTSFYNSCVDSKSNPSIFVIFEKHQIYPEYLIEYH
ncbi:Poly [ADP-ribose] polymerase 12 [Acipenser ruthenus]|uniref:Poly [ADP-ribose] polymerase 12 n=1 Tax=Acipenser ruthenus TaxID=7906 RepID=A0A662YYJ4_ACIRT|nr:Poly [ADP-ribose] polymerase 12 [Acipenser ruthenus]